MYQEVSKKSDPIHPRKLIDGQPFDEIIQHLENDINKTINLFNNIQLLIAGIVEKNLTNSSTINLLNLAREIWDHEILSDACIQAVPASHQTQYMQSWKPFPYIGRGGDYLAYKKARFISDNNLGIYVDDEAVLDFLSINLDNKSEKKEDKTQRNIVNKGGRPKDPQIEDRLNSLRTKYHELRNKQGLSKLDSLGILKEEFSEWTLSTIETYLKR